jgi:glutathione-regulated potassium-efflux system ancillary protein KefC
LESLFTSIDYRDPLWIAMAFVFGALGRAIGLPPLVGFLVAGFVLNYAGVQGGEFLYEMADIGVTMLLFTIGLKLKVRELLQREIWASALINMLLFGLLSVAYIFLLRKIDIPLVNNLTLTGVFIIGFALSFSSTVFVVKTLEVSGNFGARYGQIAIGVLIIQDLAAVLYLGISEAKTPSVWALILLAVLFFGRRFLGRILNHIGHGELQVLFGLSMAVGGAALFEAVDMKGDLGALLFGILLASHVKSDDLARALFSLKELFLVGFFLSIGLTGLPTFATWQVAGLLSLLLVFKSSLFFLLFTHFRVRAYSASNAALTLGNYSEFGLIVTSVAVAKGWLPAEWLIEIAVLVATSFVISAILNRRSEYLYDRFQGFLRSFQHPIPAIADASVDLSGVNVLICGMGRVGCGAYEQLHTDMNVLALDYDRQRVEIKRVEGLSIEYADVSSTDFWSQLDIQNSGVEWILLATPNVKTNIAAATLARRWGYTGFISAAAKYADDQEKLIESGIDTVFNIYGEAGAGLALHGKNQLKSKTEATHTSV